MAEETVDVLIVGAGLSGIGAACHLKRECPERSVTIVEGRQRLGGTWDLFRYPGVRSDSDMYTLGYSFRPWGGEQAIAAGEDILQYLRDTARDEGIEGRIRYGHRVRRASWSSQDAQWTVDIERDGGDNIRMRCAFLLMCIGYYDTSEGYTPDFAGIESFKGRIVHPQHWSEDIDYAGKRVLVIGSGATAVTLVPALARDAAHVTMLQRSPTYMVSRPSIDPVAMWLRRRLGLSWSHGLTRWKNLLFTMYVFRLCRRKPAQVKAAMIGMVKKELGDNYDVNTHFTPRYNPWEQRLCLVPDGDLFKSIREQRASIVTDQIASFTEKGVRLASGAELEADLVVTATGLKLKPLGGLEFVVDGQKLEASKMVSYKGVMFGGVPNLASVFGYTNASWTLKADLASGFVCRLLNHMKRNGIRQCIPQVDDSMATAPWVDLSSGYFQRVLSQLPRQGTKKPWKLNQNYLADMMTLRFGSVNDGVMRFSG
ncbi:NAD(P)/FAD-dependent oxidoreductase [Variovorax sp. J22R133]|uniref:flavin-containing monooxygenase n=1 Tax=Variovorax brevis TaxID=3053503 RepID=UPI0025782530|nr:NAD(P)/FAD-dependent oxidoreductase [Variovorax sp. J22R133]MDM0113407.1 NAD(P)/FAD-dependent oxidoreductase [Variovorax sp. J22R133]